MISIAKGTVFTGDVPHYNYEKSFFVKDKIKYIKFKFFGGGKVLYFHIFDSTGALRLQHKCFPDPSEAVIHEDENRTGFGSVFGELPKGEWVIKGFTYAYRRDIEWKNISFEIGITTGTDPEEIELAFSTNWVDKSLAGKGSIFLRNFEPENEGLNNEKWLSGDFHVHSVLSDGSSTPAELIDEGIRKKLDFFFITDHNILATNFPRKNEIDVFPSYEVTTYDGHFNALGLNYLPNSILSSGQIPSWDELLSTLITEFRKKEILISINHPFLEPWHWMYEDLPLSWIDCIEILSDPYSAPAEKPNEKAFSLLDVLWNNGYRITGIGGSDTHTKYSDSQLGEPITMVFAVPGSLTSLLSNIKKGRVQILFDTKCCFSYSIGGKEIFPGTAVGYTGDDILSFNIKPDMDCETLILRIVENGIIVDEVKIIPGEEYHIERIWKKKSEWMRCELRDMNNVIRGYINPVYRGNRTPGLKKWGDALELLN